MENFKKPTYIKVLKDIVDGKVCYISEIIKENNFPNATVQNIINTLKEKGFIEPKETNPQEYNKIPYKSTEQGKDFLKNHDLIHSAKIPPNTNIGLKSKESTLEIKNPESKETVVNISFKNNRIEQIKVNPKYETEVTSGTVAAESGSKKNKEETQRGSYAIS